ncbi:MAG: glycerophosphodiester phosphodiesterase [Actinobacteria bacterium]|nr:glycerophosphodiester phosphodiesterase [Actinomycetota bacterium]
MQPPVPYLDGEYPIRFAHRGSRVLWPENTAVAFAGAVDLGYRYIETDVRITRDGVVVVFHDDTLDRTTNGKGPVKDWLFEDIKHLDAGWWFDRDAGFPQRGGEAVVSSLDETFERFPEVRFNIDLKGPGMEWPVADVIRRHGRETSVMVGSFKGRRIGKFRRVTGGAVATSAGPAAALSLYSASRIGKTVSTAASAFQVPFDYWGINIDEKFVAAAHRCGAHVHCWTVNEAADMHRLLDVGVDGIVTDRPDTLNEVIAQR